MFLLLVITEWSCVPVSHFVSFIYFGDQISTNLCNLHNHSDLFPGKQLYFSCRYKFFVLASLSHFVTKRYFGYLFIFKISSLKWFLVEIMYKMTYPFYYMQNFIEKGERCLKSICLDKGESEKLWDWTVSFVFSLWYGINLECDFSSVSWRFEKLFTQDQIFHESKMTILETTPFLLQHWSSSLSKNFPTVYCRVLHCPCLCGEGLVRAGEGEAHH